MTDPTPSPLTITRKEIADDLQLTERSVDRLRKKDPNFPRPLKLGNAVRYLRSEYERWLASKKVTVC